MIDNNQKQIAGAILIAGILIAGAILLKDNKATAPAGGTAPTVVGNPSPVNSQDRVLGDSHAKVQLILYEDFQCPFCGKLHQESETPIRDSYVKDGSVLLVYRDFPFLGAESTRAAEAARCAEDQGKFWDYHDYLFDHQNGENQGNFSDTKLKSFAKTIGLNTTEFNSCFDGNKYEKAVADAKAEATTAGVTGTPKGYIVKGGKVIDTIDGALPYSAIQQKLDAALK